MSEVKCELCGQLIQQGQEFIRPGNGPSWHWPPEICVRACMAEIARLTAENERLELNVDAYATEINAKCILVTKLYADLAEAKAKLNAYEQAVEIVTDPEHPGRAFGGGTWTMVADNRYWDLMAAEEQLADAREAAREISQHVTDCDKAMDYVARWPWLEEK